MTEDELEDVLRGCPILYHMAEAGSWRSIRAQGLLSTTSLLDLHRVEGPEREAIEARRRPTSRLLETSGIGRALIRDNGPISDAGLAPLLDDGLTTTQWYRLLNARVFFWPSRDRLLRLMRAYPLQDHDVLEVDSRELVGACRPAVTLSPINSGAIGQARKRRGLGTFLPIEAYPYADRRHMPRAKRIAEVAVLGSVPRIESIARRVVRMRDGKEVQVVWDRSAPDGG